MKTMLSDAIERMTRRIAAILEDVAPSIYLYGSAVMDDFQMGWSDVDILVLTKRRIAQGQAERLLTLRQTMLAERPENRLFRAFEGSMLSLEAFESGAEDTVIYWGTSGERIAARYTFDSFCMQELLDCGVLLYGADVRARFSEPRAEELRADVLRHYESIRRFARETGRSFYAYGWLLDISRCIYTLRTGRVIAKTAAGEWALAQRLCPCEGALLRAVIVRRNPQRYQNSRAAMDYAQSLGASVQAYADVLERELARDGGPEPHGARS